MNSQKTKNIWTSDLAVIGYISAFTVLLHIIAIEGFGFFRDEFYYISCSEHLSFGYVDHPPLSILLLKIIRLLFGDSVIALRILPVLGSGAVVFMTGLIARELGGGRFAMLLAAIASFAHMGNFFLYSFYSMNFLDQLFWLALIYIFIKIIKSDDPALHKKYWLLFGIIAGLGLQNKISVLFIGFAIFAGLVLTSHRVHFKNKYLWFGAGIAGVIFLPYIIWNMVNGWPTLEFMHNARAIKMTSVTPIEFINHQINHNNIVNILIWPVGLIFFFFHKPAKTYRIFGFMYISLLLLMMFQQAKPYYMAGIYPLLFAGGAVMWETWLKKGWKKFLRPVVTTAIVIPTFFLMPLTLPILSVDSTLKVLEMAGLNADSGENHEIGPLPQHFADMHGWPEMVEKVAGVYNRLTPEEKKECIIFATNYGVTGAINFLGKKYNLPRAYSNHNSHFFWPPEKDSGKIIIIIGGSKEDHIKNFREVTEMARTRHPYAMPYESNKPIYICRDLKHPLDKIWPSIKKFI